MHIPFEKKWIFIEREDYANYLFVVATWEGVTSSMPARWAFTPGRFLGAEYHRSSCTLFAEKEAFDSANEKYFQMLFTAPKRWDALHRLTKKNSDAMFRFGKQLRKLDARKLSNTALVRVINLFQKAQMAVHVPRGPMWLLETPNNIVSEYLHRYLAEKAEDIGRSRITPFDAFRILTAPLQKSVWAKEQEELTKIACLASARERERRLAAHTKKYEWLAYGLQGKILDVAHFREELAKIQKKGARAMLRQLRNESAELRRQQKEVVRAYNIHPKHERIFRIIQDSFYTRLYSKDSQFFGYYCIEHLLREVGRRGGLTLEQVRFLTPKDFRDVLVDGKDLSAITTERQRYSIHISDRGKTVFAVGDAARRIRKRMKFYVADQKHVASDVVHGQPAYQGKARGRVKIVNTIAEMAKMHAGNILVSRMTSPGIVPAMKMAAAIVTDAGGITCHAAIVARELKKPCLIGTKVATKAFKDGDEVVVDAVKGTIKKV